MSKTMRRTNFIPKWVTEKAVIVDYELYRFMSTWIPLEGKEKSKALKLWHRDRGQKWNMTPPKWLRGMHEAQLRKFNQKQIHLWLKDENFEATPQSKPKLWRWY